MSVKLKISVTKEILEKTKNCEKGNTIVSNCAIAEAVRSIFPNATVGCSTLSFHINDKCAEWVRLPLEAIHLIAEFDRSVPAERVEIEPIEFEINVPDKVISKINIEEIRPLLQGHPTLELIEQ